MREEEKQMDRSSKAECPEVAGPATNACCAEGAGLGLAITRSIIRAHGGEISVRCGIDGVCFEIRLAR